MNNDERPDRAPAQTTTSSNNTTPDTRSQSPNDDDKQQDERSFFERAADIFTAPPTDTYGNPRSTSPVADRLNNTVSISFNDIANFIGLTPDQSRTLETSAAVMEGVVVTPSPKEQVQLYQADLRLQQRGLEYQRSKLGDNIHPRSPDMRKAADIDRQLNDLARRREVVETVTRPDLATGIEPNILHFDPAADGQIVVGYGDIKNASHIAVLVPGTTANLNNFPTMERRSMDAMKALLADPEFGNPAVVAYLGYDAPNKVVFEAMSQTSAVEGAPALAEFLNGLPEGAEVHVVPHSYATLLTGKALEEGARPDYVHGLGPAGFGFDSVHGKPFENDVVITVTENPDDFVAIIGYHGAVPPKGSISYPPTGRGHTDDPDIPDDANYFAPEVIRDMMAGRRQPLEQ